MSLLSLGTSVLSSLAGGSPPNKRDNKIALAHTTDWAFSSLYHVEDLFLTTTVNSIISNFKKNVELFGSISDADISTLRLKNLIVKSVDIGPITFQEIVEWSGGHWSYTTGRQEMKKVDITFMDVKGGRVYYILKYIMTYVQYLYPEDQQWTINIKLKKGQSFRDFGNIGANEKIDAYSIPLIWTTKAILMQLGNISLDQENPNLMEFTASFVYEQESEKILSELDKLFGGSRRK